MPRATAAAASSSAILAQRSITGTTADSNISAGFETRFLSERASPLTLIASATAEDSSLSVGKNRTAITSGTTTAFGSLIP